MTHTDSDATSIPRFEFVELDLSTQKTITSLELESIRQFQGDNIKIGVDELNEELAASLVSVTCCVDFVALKDLDLNAAMHLTHFKGCGLDFTGLETISPDALKALVAHFKQSLTLGLHQLTCEQSKVLSEAGLNSLAFSRLTTISSEAAYWLHKSNATLLFEALETLSAETAAVLLNEFHGIVAFEKLQVNSVELASALATHHSDLYLDGVRELLPEIAERLFQHQGELLALTGLKAISLETARKITHGEKSCTNLSSLWLGLETLDNETAELLANLKRGISFFYLSEMSEDIARIFSTARCTWLNFNNDIKLDQSAKEALFAFPRDLNLRDNICNL